MQGMERFLQIYGTLPRAGVGSTASTRRAYAMLHDLPVSPRVLDLGCGPGQQTVDLLEVSGGTVVALDFLPSMIERTQALAAAAGVSDRLETLVRDMNDMDLSASSFDVVWSEGAIYNLGFARGLEVVRDLVRPGGFVVVSDAFWTTADPPALAVELWRQYPEMAMIDRKLEVIARLDYRLVRHFVQPDSDWTDAYYEPMAARIAELAPTWRGDPDGEAVLAEARREIEVFQHAGDSYGYAFFVLQRPTGSAAKGG